MLPRRGFQESVWPLPLVALHPGTPWPVKVINRSSRQASSASITPKQNTRQFGIIMRRPFVAGNWKMNLNRAQAVELAAALAVKAGENGHVEIGVCPPSIYLEAVRGALGSSAIGLGAQNCYHEAKGAFTGELSPAMLVDQGCKYVVLGHSERRHIFKETSQDVNKKVLAALAAGLTPIVCVGELLDERKAGRTQA